MLPTMRCQVGSFLMSNAEKRRTGIFTRNSNNIAVEEPSFILLKNKTRVINNTFLSHFITICTHITKKAYIKWRIVNQAISKITDYTDKKV
jgi:hypothetical protein